MHPNRPGAAQSAPLEAGGKKTPPRARARATPAVTPETARGPLAITPTPGTGTVPKACWLFHVPLDFLNANDPNEVRLPVVKHLHLASQRASSIQTSVTYFIAVRLVAF